jgi:hypothetical protein
MNSCDSLIFYDNFSLSPIFSGISKPETVFLEPASLNVEKDSLKRKNDTKLITDNLKNRKTTNFDITAVVEVYSSCIKENFSDDSDDESSWSEDFSNYDPNSSLDYQRLQNELDGNGESGVNLAKIFHPGSRYIYSNTERVSRAVFKYANKYFGHQNIVNLYENNALDLGEKSKLIVVGQGDPVNNHIADFDSNDFIDTIFCDLNVNKLSEIEFHVCMLGLDNDYLNAISKYFCQQTKIISYPDLIVTKQSGEKKAFNLEGNPIKLVQNERM